MSKPMILSKPAASDVRTAPTMPPRGRQDRVLALETPRVGQAPFDCMNIRRTFCSSAATLST